ncbi:50S ribosomal protein L32 [Enterococcus faecalis]|uniref:50S ribosomal protein L32 n=1 Tax=Staphylococcus aureus TaxID=1280 RepID=UPI000675D299
MLKYFSNFYNTGGNKYGCTSEKNIENKKRLRRTHEKLKSPEISFDENLGDYRKSHHVSLKGYYGGKKVMDKK